MIDAAARVDSARIAVRKDAPFVSTLMSVMMIERLIELCLFAVLTTSERGVGRVLVA